MGKRLALLVTTAAATAALLPLSAMAESGVRIGPADVTERAIAIRVTPEEWAHVELRGQVLWKEDGRLVAGANLAESTKRLGAGKGGTFRVPIPGEVQRRLAGMAPGASLTAKLEFFVTDRGGFESERSRRVALWGNQR